MDFGGGTTGDPDCQRREPGVAVEVAEEEDVPPLRAADVPHVVFQPPDRGVLLAGEGGEGHENEESGKRRQYSNIQMTTVWAHRVDEVVTCQSGAGDGGISGKMADKKKRK